jgi:hypothetical protein
MRAAHGLWGAILCLAILGCSRERAASAGGESEELAAVHFLKPAAPARAPAGTSIAYEHSVEVRVPGNEIPQRIDAVQSSCFSQKFGDCAVLNVEQRGGDFPRGSITVRIDPKGVEPLLGAASEGGDVVSRTLRADDLAEAVTDNQLRRARLEKERARLLEFQDKPNIKLEDMLRLSKRLSEVEAQLDVAEQEHAQQRRRIDTNRLTIEFQTTRTEAGRFDIGDAFRDAGRVFAASVAFMIRALAAAVPVVLILALVVVLVRALRRRSKAR